MEVTVARGKLITFEGVDGSGLSTQARLLEQWLVSREHEVYLTKEPSEGPSGAIVRLMLAKRLERPDGYVLSLLFAADRMDHIAKDILPFLDRGIHVISDRYYLSTYAYQSESVPLEWLRQLNKFCIRPDLTCWINADPLVARKRIDSTRFSRQLTENPDELLRVYDHYKKAVDLLRREGENIVEINGVQPVSVVARDVQKEVRRVISRAGSSTHPRLPLD
jgi:dTMP kinase